MESNQKLLYSKGNLPKQKDNLQNGKVFANMTNKGLISKIPKKLMYTGTAVPLALHFF